MSTITFDGVGKVYPDGTHAVHDLSLVVEDGEFVALVGPSGCGKTTALRMVAGLEDVTHGAIRVDDGVINTLEPRKRDIAMVFQNYALYPHMSVFENMAFPLRARRMPKEEVTERVQTAAALLGLTEHLRRRPKNLSGGQRQRVAMGRAIVRQPRLFLMDEPLSNLDAKLRVQMRAETARLQHELGVTTIYVTHDQVEAMTMASRIAIMRKGVLQQYGAPQELYDRPVNMFVATFIGSPAMSLFRAAVDVEGGRPVLVTNGQRVPVPQPPRGLVSYVGRDVAVGIRPEHLTEGASPDPQAPKLHGEVTLVEVLGSERLVHLRLDAEPVLTDQVLEVAADSGAAELPVPGATGAGQTTAVARFDARSTVAVNDRIDVGIVADGFRFFDLGTGDAIG